jgi:hypothetical protein
VFDLITDLDRLSAWNAAVEHVIERPAALASRAEWVVVMMHPPRSLAWKNRSRVEEIDRSRSGSPAHRATRTATRPMPHGHGRSPPKTAPVR